MTVDYGDNVLTIDSIVLGAFETAARRRELRLAPDVKDYLISQVRTNLDAAHSRGELESRRAEVEQNTEVLVNYLASSEQQVTEIRIDHVDSALEWLCSRYKKFFPFCPRP